MALVEFKEAINRFQLCEDIQLHKRDLYSRINRKLREKLNPPVRDILKARRERQQRHRRHRFTGVDFKPRKMLSTTLRFR
jgi:hypothetical protein